MKKTLLLFLVVFATFALAQERPAWQSVELTNAATGEVFTLGGFEGKSVFVEPMATWCSNCRTQLGNVNVAIPEAGEDSVFVALSVEGNLANEQLAAYAEKEGFDMIFAVAPTDLLRGLVDAFGREITSPPSTPHFIIRPDGTTTDLATGREAPEVILEQLAASKQ